MRLRHESRRSCRLGPEEVYRGLPVEGAVEALRNAGLIITQSTKAAMKRVIATIHLIRTEEGGRKQPLPPKIFGCPVFFENVPELQEHGYDCRFLLAEHAEPISPGRTVDGIALLFLSPDEVLPHMKPGVRFSLWEGKTIGSGTVIRVEDAP